VFWNISISNELLSTPAVVVVVVSFRTYSTAEFSCVESSSNYVML